MLRLSGAQSGLVFMLVLSLTAFASPPATGITMTTHGAMLKLRPVRNAEFQITNASILPLGDHARALGEAFSVSLRGSPPESERIQIVAGASAWLVGARPAAGEDT